MKNSTSLITLVALIGFVGSAYAGDAAKNQAAATHQLKDGGTLYIFKDGKMAKESKYGKAVYMKKGETLDVQSRVIISPVEAGHCSEPGM